MKQDRVAANFSEAARRLAPKPFFCLSFLTDTKPIVPALTDLPQN